ncbi:hypothetical protein [Schleiferilactobacillus harbinensis]|uniref:hypothetical protein n=1 Tax=Schleiferilactobacillus harbinensis TaxID=304207 RepID=UPI00116E67D9|nr:hypothetical protein [Schleiferilactobacillus harbinensis]GEK06637.1 hypothetical protein LHA01_18760 [Schleiferilactobacillus harbinensis]
MLLKNGTKVLDKNGTKVVDDSMNLLTDAGDDVVGWLHWLMMLAERVKWHGFVDQVICAEATYFFSCF